MNRNFLIVFIALTELTFAVASFSDDCPEKCDMAYDPVCGSNGRTYKNSCHMARDNCFAKTKVVEIHKGECLKSEDDDKTEEIQPYSCLRVGRGKYLKC